MPGWERRARRANLFLLLIFHFSPFTLHSPLWAQDDRARLLRFADELLQHGEAYRAITEYLRYGSYYPDDPLAAEVPLRIGLAYLYGGRPDQALQALAPAVGSERPEVRSRAAYLKGRAYYEAGEFRLALSSWKDVAPGGPEEALVRQHSLYSLLRLGLRAQALEQLQRGAAGLDDAEQQRLASRLQASALPRRRSPVLAGVPGVLSGVVPGAGQLYAGRRRDALVAFLLNALFVLGAVQAFRSGNEATGVILTSVEAGWYAGNIASAASSARRANELALERYLQRTVDLPALEAQGRAAETRMLLGVRIAF
jgi:tetratricopeptide (TPR) repeat protein